MYRRNLKHSRVKSLFKFASLKMDSVMTVESALEFDTCFHFEYSPDVISFEAQPEGFYYRLLGKELPYTPDFLVVDKIHGKRFIQVKSVAKAANSDFRAEYVGRQERAAELGTPLILVTERQIYLNPLLNNLKLLHRYAGLKSFTDLQFLILELAKKSDSVSVRNLISSTQATEGDVLASTITLLSLGRLKTDLSSSDLGLDSVVWSLDVATPDLSSNNSGLFEDEFSQNEPDIPLFKEHSAETFPRDLATYPAKLRDEAYRRLDYIEWVGKRLEGGWTEKNLTPLLNAVKDKLQAPLPSWRTLAGWRKLYVSSGRSIEALVPKHHKKGSRVEQNTGDNLYYWQAVDQKYFRLERPSIASVYQYYRDLITLANKGVVEGKVTPVSRRAFYNRINKLPPYEVALKRYGKQYADRKFRPVGTHIAPTRVMERVEIDHTPLDLILLDDELNIPLGRPYLTLLIDTYSLCVVGFYLGYREPSYDSVCKALLNTCLDKSYVKKQFPHIQHDWECSGKIETLVVDNGAEFWSKNLDEICRALGIDIQYNPVGQPWLKPLIERFFGTVNTKLIEAVPGKTFSKVDDLKYYNPKKDAVIRFSTIPST